MKLDKGEIIYVEGERSRGIFKVKRGLVKLFLVSEDGKQIAFDLAGKGEIFGSPNEYKEFAQAFTDCEVELISNPTQREIEKLLEKSEQHKRHLFEIISLPLEKRIIAVGMRIAKKLGSLENGFISIKITHEELAEFCGATRECVSNTLALLEKKGIVSTSRKNIRLKISPTYESIIFPK